MSRKGETTIEDRTGEVGGTERAPSGLTKWTLFTNTYLTQLSLEVGAVLCYSNAPQQPRFGSLWVDRAVVPIKNTQLI